MKKNIKIKKLKISSKKGFSFLSDVISWVLIILVILAFSIAIEVIKPSKFYLKATKEKLNNDIFIITLLKYPTDDGTLLETILIDYGKNNFENSKNIINKIFLEAFEKNICYNFFIDNKKFGEQDNCLNSKEIQDLSFEIDSKINILYNDKLIELWIKNI